MTTAEIEYSETEKFQKDFKKLLKRYRSLNEDLEVVKRNAIELFHLNHINNNSVFLIPGFCSEEIQICKVKKFACKTLKGRGANSGLRLIYAYIEKLKKVEFIEIYFKADQENENRERIKLFLSRLPGSNRGPAVYDTAALPTELRRLQ